MNIIPYHLAETKDLLTSRSGLVVFGELMNELNLPQLADRYMPQPKSNRGFKPSTYVSTLMLMLHEGGYHLSDVAYLHEDRALTQLLGLNKLPKEDALSDFLYRLGHHDDGLQSIQCLNQTVLKRTLHHRRSVTLDIDASFVPSHNREARWSYKKERGYMPMFGHIEETGQLVAAQLRHGNVAPASDNHGFIKHCQSALPQDVYVKHLRSDAAGYQVAILDDCIDQDIKFAIRAKRSSELKRMIEQQADEDWQPLITREGNSSDTVSTCRLVHCMNKSRHSFTVIVQREPKQGQLELSELDSHQQDTMTGSNGYIYRAIATNRTDLTDSQIIHWYNQRAEASENRIKELKLDFGGNNLPCHQFQANAVYLALCALAYNLLALLRESLPSPFQSCRAKTIRLRLYALAGKLVRHGRKVCLKLRSDHQQLLSKALACLQQVAQAP